MAYAEPPASFSMLKPAPSGGSATTALLRDSGGLELEIEYLDEVGWGIEVRYDRLSPLIKRQPFTGIQPSLSRSSLGVEVKTAQVSIVSAKERVAIDSRSGRFALSLGGKEYFASHETPFSYHAAPTKIFEDLCSLKFTEWELATPFRLTPTEFETHMLRFQYPLPEGLILGLPGQTGEMNRRGYRFELCNADQFYHIPSRLPLYQSWPILFQRATSGAGWVAIFHDNPARTFVDLGDFYPTLATFESVTNNTRLYICVGASLAELSTKLCRLLGDSVFPASWAFGYQQCRFSYRSTAEVREVVGRLETEKIPLDCVYFDGDYMDGYRVFTRDPKAFGDLTECIHELRGKGVESVCIVDPGLKAEDGYELYDKVLETGKYLRKANGSPFYAKVWPGSCLLPDFHTSEIQKLWSEAQKQFLEKYPFSGIWNDMNEPSNFDGSSERNATAFTERGSHRSEFNIYGFAMAKASASGWEQFKPGKRSLIITRSGYPGVQRYAIIWHGDNSAWWEHLRLAIDTAITYSLCGAYFTGPDVPGFFGNPSDDLAVRFFQLGAFMPFFRGHSYTFAKDKEPFAYEPETRRRIRAAIELRYSLLREWYSGFERAVREKRSVMLPVLDQESRLVRDAFLLFDKFLVYPITQRDEVNRSIFLPAGEWYRFGDSTRLLEGNKWHLETISLEEIPVFVRAGSVVVRNTPGRNVRNTFSRPERFEIYPDRKGEADGYWYDDDGQSILDSNAKRLNLKAKNGQVSKSEIATW